MKYEDMILKDVVIDWTRVTYIVVLLLFKNGHFSHYSDFIHQNLLNALNHKNGIIITWILHKIFMFSNKVKLTAG